VRVNELLGQMLLSAINLAYYQTLMAGMREAIAQRRFADFCTQIREDWERGDIPPL
jgi:queuine tRNA-ribosyltransferase